MTATELSKLTPEEKCIKIAEECGFYEVELPFGWIPPQDIGDLPDMIKVPDYLNDLNAICQATISMNVEQATKYIEILAELVIDNGSWAFNKNKYMAFVVCNASAAQRADAFLLTI